MRTAYLKSLIASMSFIALVVVWADGRTAYAQPIHASTRSIESIVANADLVFVAKVVKFDEAKKVNGFDVYPTTIAIERTLKMPMYHGEPFKQMQVNIHGTDALLSDYQEHSSPLLIACDEETSYATAIELVAGKMEIFKADFTLLREPDAVIQAAEESLRRMTPGVKRVYTFDLLVPSNFYRETQWTGYSGLFLNVPVDEQLEKRAFKHIQSDSYSERLEGVNALRYFKSDENIERFKSLLDDSGWSYLKHPQYNNGLEVRIYSVRDVAYKTLKLWGVNVEQPKIREEVMHPTK